MAMQSAAIVALKRYDWWDVVKQGSVYGRTRKHKMIALTKVDAPWLAGGWVTGMRDAQSGLSMP